MKFVCDRRAPHATERIAYTDNYHRGTRSGLNTIACVNRYCGKPNIYMYTFDWRPQQESNRPNVSVVCVAHKRKRRSHPGNH